MNRKPDCKKEESLGRENEIELKRMLHAYCFRYRLRNGSEPSEKLIQKERARLIKKHFANDKSGLSQSEKEEGQLKCLIRFLRDEGGHFTLEEMSDHLVGSGYTVGSSVKTIYRRILPELMERGVEKDKQGKYYIPEYHRNPEMEKRMADSMKERMQAVSIISNFLETLKGTPVYEKAKEYVDDEMRAYRRRERHESKKELDEASLVSRIIFMGAPAAKIQNGIWDVLNSAMQENKYVSILYKAEERGNPQKYTVQPYQLIFDNGFWDLWGMCTSTEHMGRKLFNLSRIIDVDILKKGEPFILPDNYDFRSTLAGNFGCYNDDIVENYSIMIKKDSYAYQYIKGRTWGEFQEIKKVKDGYILEFEATQYLPILRWVLSWGPDVKPLEPEKLVRDWKQKIREMASLG